MVRIGKVARPHGVRGALAVTLDDPSSESLLGVAYVHLGEGEAWSRHEVARTAKGRPGQILLFLRDVSTVEAAEALRDREVRLEEAQLPPLGEEEYWQRDLLGMEALRADGSRLGTVEEVVDTAEVPVLVVRHDGGETFVPFHRSHVLSVDVAGKAVVVDPPEVLEP
jgi:16S rRNA processing protein RimM